MNWIIIPTAGVSSSNGLNSDQHPEGTKTEHQFGDSLLVYQVNYANNSFLSATLTILNPIRINGTVINCNGNSLSFTLKSPSELNIYTHTLKHVIGSASSLAKKSTTVK